MNYHQKTKLANNIIHDWSRKTVFQLRGSILRKTKSNHKLLKAKQIKQLKKAKKRVPLVNSLTTRTEFSVTGNADRVYFGMPPHGIFLKLGASRKHKHKKNPRKIIDWFNPVMDERLPVLANKLAELDADFALKYIRIENKKASNF